MRRAARRFYSGRYFCGIISAQSADGAALRLTSSIGRWLYYSQSEIAHTTAGRSKYSLCSCFLRLRLWYNDDARLFFPRISITFLGEPVEPSSCNAVAICSFVYFIVCHDVQESNFLSAPPLGQWNLLLIVSPRAKTGS